LQHPSLWLKAPEVCYIFKIFEISCLFLCLYGLFFDYHSELS
jgi:hypothetical protein